MSVCKAVDDFIRDKDKAYWIATLSNGEQIFEDDERPGLERVSWFRLKEYCQANNLSIVKIEIRFRSSSYLKVFDCDNSDGVFFCRQVLGVSGLTNSDNVARSIDYYLFGIVNGNSIEISKCIVPELLIEEHETREVLGYERNIIWNYGRRLQGEQLTSLTT